MGYAASSLAAGPSKSLILFADTAIALSCTCTQTVCCRLSRSRWCRKVKLSLALSRLGKRIENASMSNTLAIEAIPLGFARSVVQLARRRDDPIDVVDGPPRWDTSGRRGSSSCDSMYLYVRTIDNQASPRPSPARPRGAVASGHCYVYVSQQPSPSPRVAEWGVQLGSCRFRVLDVPPLYKECV